MAAELFIDRSVWELILSDAVAMAENYSSIGWVFKTTQLGAMRCKITCAKRWKSRCLRWKGPCWPASTTWLLTGQKELFSKMENCSFFMDIFEHMTVVCAAWKLEMLGLLFAALDVSVYINHCLHKKFGFLLSRERKLERTWFKLEFLFWFISWSKWKSCFFQKGISIWRGHQTDSWSETSHGKCSHQALPIFILLCHYI